MAVAHRVPMVGIQRYLPAAGRLGCIYAAEYVSTFSGFSAGAGGTPIRGRRVLAAAALEARREVGRVLVTDVADRDPAHARTVAFHLLSILMRL